MSKFNKEFNDCLHDAFSSIQINADFTLPEFRDLVFGSKYRSKKKKTITRTFLQTRKKTGEIQVTDMKRGHSTTGRQTFIVYMKNRNAADYKTVPMNLVPDIYYEFLLLWNKLSLGQWIEVKPFFERLPAPVRSQTNSKEVSNFLWLLVDKEYANKKTLTPSINTYQKVLHMTESDLRQDCVKFTKKLVGEKTMTGGQQAAIIGQPEKVITAAKMVEVDRPVIDPDNISQREFCDAFINSRLADKEHIAKLESELAHYKKQEDRDRKTSKGKVDELNKKMCVVEREKNNLARAIKDLGGLLKNKDSTIDNLKKSADKRRTLVMQLKEQLEAANKKLEDYTKFTPIKMKDLINPQGSGDAG